MVWNDRKRLLPATVATVAFVCAIAGVVGGVSLGRAILLRSASLRLVEYANELSSYALRYGTEVSSVWDTYGAPGAEFCSPAEIASMRSSVFRSLQIKDVGRTRNRSLYCSAIGGQFSAITLMPSEYMVLANGARLYRNLSLSEPAISGPVLEENGVAVLVSPQAFDYWVRPRLHFAVLIVNPASGKVQGLAGENLEATASCALTEPEARSATVLYRVLFRDSNKTCIVTSEAISDVWAAEGPALQVYGVLGGISGLGLGLAASFIFFRRSGLVQQLRRAIRKRELFVVYQPLIDLSSRKIVGVEALVRWTPPGRGPVPPDLFVRIAEEYGFIGELTQFVLITATNELADLMRKFPRFTLSVNVAVSDLTSDMFYRNLEKQTNESGIRPAQLAFELTERSTADLTTVRAAIARLHRLHYKIHIDDFGTGFSNLSYLSELAADVIKIDRIFVQAIGTEGVTASILPQMLAMTEALGFPVVVEGVETEYQLNFLESTGKPMTVQGFYFGRAVPAATVREWMLAEKNEPPVSSNMYDHRGFPFQSKPGKAERLA